MEIIETTQDSIDGDEASSDIIDGSACEQPSESMADPISEIPLDPPSQTNDESNIDSDLTKTQFLFLRDAIKSTFDSKYGEIFRRPVDPVNDNVPDYLEIVENPMDLGTILKKLDDSAYTCVDECVEDFKLMITNCYTYNPEGSGAHQYGKEIEKFFNRKMIKFPNAVINSQPLKRKSSIASPRRSEDRRDKSKCAKVKKMTPMESEEISYSGTKDVLRSSKRSMRNSPNGDQSSQYSSAIAFCDSALNELFNKRHYEYAYPFLAPVDPIALGIPDYYDVVKYPIDLGTIRTRMKAFQYAHPQQFLRDVRLVFTNCYRYNRATTDVSIAATKLQRVFEQYISTCPKDLYYELFTTDLPIDEPPSLNVRGTRRSQNVEARQVLEGYNNIEKRLVHIFDEIARLRAEKTRYSTVSENGQVKRVTTKNNNVNPPLKNPFAANIQSLEPPKVEDVDPMTYEEKLSLSSQLISVSENHIKEIVSIIHQHEPWTRKVSQTREKGMVEFNLESLQTSTLRIIQKYLHGLNRKKSDLPHRKKISAEERGSRVEVLKRRLEDMDMQLSGKVPIAIGSKKLGGKEKNNDIRSRLSDSGSESEVSDEEFAKRYSFNKSSSTSKPPGSALPAKTSATLASTVTQPQSVTSVKTNSQFTTLALKRPGTVVPSTSLPASKPTAAGACEKSSQSSFLSRLGITDSRVDNCDNRAVSTLTTSKVVEKKMPVASPFEDISKRREEERRKRMSLVGKIDINAQSDLMKTFEEHM